jgi:hypothetical protein
MIMSVLEDTPWDDGHHHSILFLEQHTLENYQQISTPSTIVVISTVLESTHNVFAEGNLSNISPTIPIDISIKPGIVENVHIGASYSFDEIVTYTSLFKEFRDIFAWSYEEMSGIDPEIVIHEIKTYPDAKPVRQRLRPVHPRKEAAIKLEVEKLLKDGFIYPVALTYLVSNLVLIDKKQGTIRVCVLIIGILIKLVQKTTFLPLLSIKLSMTTSGVKSFLLWMVSLVIIKLTSFPRINIRLLLFVLGVLLLIGNFLLVLRTLAPLLNALCLMHFMISSTSFNPIWTIYSLILCAEPITPTISGLFSFTVGSTGSI